MASSSADCVFGEARLISSARSTLAKIATGAELELVGGAVPDRHAGDVGRQEVGGELDAVAGAADRRRDRLGQRRLAHAGDVLDEEVTLGEEAHEREVHLLPLALDDAFDVAEQGGEQAAERRVAARRGGGLNHEHLQSGPPTVPEGLALSRVSAGQRCVAAGPGAGTVRTHDARAVGRRCPGALPGPSFWWRATLLVLARPGLWWTALRQALRLARPRWWTRAPFLPLPDAAYLQLPLRDAVRRRRPPRSPRPGRLPRLVPEGGGVGPGRLASRFAPVEARGACERGPTRADRCGGADAWEEPCCSTPASSRSASCRCAGPSCSC